MPTQLRLWWARFALTTLLIGFMESIDEALVPSEIGSSHLVAKPVSQQSPGGAIRQKKIARM